MKILDVMQGSPAWIAARLGIPTASAAKKIIQPVKLKPSSAQDDYLNVLVAEWALGRPLDEQTSEFMLRGTAMESEAVAWYELTHDVEVQRVGFCTSDGGTYGCSPDGLVGDTGGLEIKCPAANTHIGHLLDPLNIEYKAQVQFSMLVTGRAWWDRVSYHPDLPKSLTRFERDEVFCQALANCLRDFNVRLEEAKYRLRQMGVEPAIRTPSRAAFDPEAVLA